jgi:ferredoxin
MTAHLRVNPVACTGHGLCAELLPELITLDEWGYPLLADQRVPARLERHARRAVAACPALALLLAEPPGVFRADSEPAHRDRAGPGPILRP